MQNYLLLTAKPPSQVPAATYASTVLAMSPVGYWRLGEPSGTTAVDEVGAAHNGTYVGTPTLGVTGLVAGSDTAVTLTTSSQYVSITSAAALHPTDPFSIAAWILRTPGAEQNIWVSGNNDVQVEFYTDNKLYLSKKGAVDLFMSTPTYTTLATHFVVVTMDATVVTVYVDGATIAGTTAAGTFVASATAISVGLPIGAGAGTIDEVALWDRALTPTEVTSLYSFHV